MDPIIGGSLISAGSSLLGGLFGSKTRSAGRNFRSHINGLMRAAEDHKFNPLALLGVSPIGPSTSVNPLGAAIADAGAIAADGILRNSAAQKLERAERLNAKLSQDLTDAKLRPKIPGVYAAGGSVAAASGGRNAWPNSKAYISGHSGEVFSYSRGGELVTPVERHTVETFHNDGQSTDVPIGPDFDEVASGWIIQQRNKGKARAAAHAATLGRKDMTYGSPLHVPTDFVPAGLGGTYVVDRPDKLLPPRVKKRRDDLPKGYKGYTNPRYSSPSYYSDRIYRWVRERGH